MKKAYNKETKLKAYINRILNTLGREFVHFLQYRFCLLLGTCFQENKQSHGICFRRISNQIKKWHLVIQKIQQETFIFKILNFLNFQSCWVRMTGLVTLKKQWGWGILAVLFSIMVIANLVHFSFWYFFAFYFSLGTSNGSLFLLIFHMALLEKSGRHYKWHSILNSYT